MAIRWVGLDPVLWDSEERAYSVRIDDEDDTVVQVAAQIPARRTTTAPPLGKPVVALANYTPDPEEPEELRVGITYAWTGLDEPEFRDPDEWSGFTANGTHHAICNVEEHPLQGQLVTWFDNEKLPTWAVVPEAIPAAAELLAQHDS